ncbi:MAG: hypothetical protein ACOYI2_09325 [Bacillota bacterium]|jgi:hypothetical protein
MGGLLVRVSAKNGKHKLSKCSLGDQPHEKGLPFFAKVSRKKMEYVE